MKFGYFPDFKQKSFLKDTYLKVFGYPFASRRIEAWLVLSKMKNLSSNTKILDIGCGDGIWTNYLAQKSKAQVTGVDISEVDLKIAKKRAQYQTNRPVYKNQDASNLGFKNNSFDYVYSISTLEHTPDDQKIINEIYRVLKPGGKCIVSMPTSRVLPLMKWWLLLPKSLRFFLQTPLQQAANIQEYHQFFNKKFVHYRLYNKYTLEKKTVASGLKLKSIDYHISFFSVLIHSLVHSLKVFEWDKSVESRYNFTSEILFAATFPLFYTWYKLDSILPFNNGYALIAVLEKPAS